MAGDEHARTQGEPVLSTAAWLPSSGLLSNDDQAMTPERAGRIEEAPERRMLQALGAQGPRVELWRYYQRAARLGF